MSSRLLRNVFISAVTPTSLGTLAYTAFAEETQHTFVFSCTAPRIGTDRCGDPDKNIRVGPEKAVTVDWTTSSHPKACITFYVFHAVSNKQLASDKLCVAPKAKRLWVNPDKTSVDVYVTVGSDVPTPVKIDGFYHVHES